MYLNFLRRSKNKMDDCAVTIKNDGLQNEYVKLKILNKNCFKVIRKQR